MCVCVCVCMIDCVHLYVYHFSSVTQVCLSLYHSKYCSMPDTPSIINFQSLLKLMFIALVMPSKHLICCPLIECNLKEFISRQRTAKKSRRSWPFLSVSFYCLDSGRMPFLLFFTLHILSSTLHHQNAILHIVLGGKWLDLTL